MSNPSNQQPLEETYIWDSTNEASPEAVSSSSKPILKSGDRLGRIDPAQGSISRSPRNPQGCPPGIIHDSARRTKRPLSRSHRSVIRISSQTPHIRNLA